MDALPPRNPFATSPFRAKRAPISSVPLEPYPFQLERPHASIWPERTASSSSDLTSRLRGLWQRYNDALWLGEYHTPLLSFLDYLQRLEHLARHDMASLVAELGLLLRSRQEVKRRYADETAEAIVQLAASDSPHLTELGRLSSNEIKTIHIALQGGPPAAVKAQLEKPESSSARSLLSRWLKSTESREMQAQLLVTMFLLKIIAQHTGCVEQAKKLLSASSGADSQPHEPQTSPESRPKKRSRKLENPKRWKGGDLDSDDFLWNRKAHKRGADPFADDADEGESVLESTGPAAIEPEALNKRLEALTDHLCLDQITSGLGNELAGLLDQTDGEEATEGKSATKQDTQQMVFGSAARHRETDVEQDEVQWLCVEVVEPFFLRSLPRQCAVMRGKCFVHGASGTTPARGRTMTSGSHKEVDLKNKSETQEVESRARAAAKRRATPHLRDALQQEQAAGRRPGAGSQSMLAKGREVDMNHRFSRSASASSAVLASHFADQESGPPPFVTGKPGKRKGEAVRRPEPTTKTALVLSTPQKATKTSFHRNLSRTQLFPETQAGIRRTESQPLWGLQRSPSPVALFSGSEEEE